MKYPSHVLRVLKIVAIACLLALLIVNVAFAQVEEALPKELSDLAAPAGLGVVVVIIVGLLKRAGKVGEWLSTYPLATFGVSLAIAGVVLLAVHLVNYFGVYDEAQGFWSNFVVAWSVSQVFYNIQKAGATGVKAALDL